MFVGLLSVLFLLLRVLSQGFPKLFCPEWVVLVGLLVTTSLITLVTGLALLMVVLLAR